MILAAVLLWFEIILDPWGVFGYLGGLINVPFSHVGFMMSVGVAPWTLLCPVVLLVRMLAVWPRRLHSWRRLVLAWGIVVGAFVVGFVLPFKLPVTRSWDAFMAGVQRHVLRRVDSRPFRSGSPRSSPVRSGPGRRIRKYPSKNRTCLRPSQVSRLGAGVWNSMTWIARRFG
jgi:hypothetical protein